MKKLIASTTPLEDIAKLTYEGQPAHMRMYREGYEGYFNEMPEINPHSSTLQRSINMSKGVMQVLAHDIAESEWITEGPKAGEFVRTIIAIGEHKEDRQSPEFVVAQWGDGFTSPVHGHAQGYLHEELITGKMRVNTYRLMNLVSPVVRPVETVIYNSGTIASLFSNNDKATFKREVLIHNFTSIGYSATLHYLTEHTRDGRDNGFKVEYFGDTVDLSNDLTQIDSKQAMYAQKGDVILVRSTNVPEYGDHYIVITGHPIMKEHGFRPQERAIYAPDGTKFLDRYEMKTGLTLLKLSKIATEEFHEFHGITIRKGEVIFPSTESPTLKLERCSL